MQQMTHRRLSCGNGPATRLGAGLAW